MTTKLLLQHAPGLAESQRSHRHALSGPRAPILGHSGVTDVERGQRRVLAVLAEAPRPVLVLEHRFPAEVLDRWGAIYREGGVPVGATLLDEWAKTNYESEERIGMYEIMRARP